MREVALIFPGIFVAAVHVLMLLREGAEGRLGWLSGTLNSPAACFWASGALSSVLDNSPTCLIFFSAALGDLCCGMTEKAAVASFLRDQGIFLKAIAAGTVFMGADTYLGNGSNLLVRPVAEEERVEMPGCFGYILRYTVVVLVPTFLVVSAVLFAP